MLNRYVDGYSVEEIAEEDEQTVRNINMILNTICKSISDESLRQWRKWAYTHKLELKSKRCSRCGEELPATDEFFRPRNDGRGDGFYNQCKKCENETDRIRKSK
ncbi:hypothetical protein ACR77J_04685 [Tissierella praeacuta]|uniref:hypothetical protein n=1 Tax=Tissierella praeacuta TaxID=43131 RepID=UPI003DA49D79